MRCASYDSTLDGKGNAAFADPTRRAILARLATGEATVRLEPKRLAEANEWLEQYRQFWDASFARLEDLLDELQPKKRKHR